MRFIFKTRYDQDIDLFPHGGAVFWYSLLAVALVAAPLMIVPFYVGELSFLLIWSLAGLSLMVLTGYTGLISIGHAAFLGIGAYVDAYLIRHGMPFVPSMLLAGVATAAVGAVIAIPAMRTRALPRHRDAGLRRDRERGVRTVGGADRRLARRRGA